MSFLLQNDMKATVLCHFYLKMMSDRALRVVSEPFVKAAFTRHRHKGRFSLLNSSRLPYHSRFTTKVPRIGILLFHPTCQIPLSCMSTKELEYTPTPASKVCIKLKFKQAKARDRSVLGPLGKYLSSKACVRLKIKTNEGDTS